MQYHLSDIFANMPPPAGGDVLKLASAPGTIAFSAGNPSAETFPLQALQGIANQLFGRQDAASFFQYGVSEGYAPLREFLKSRMEGKHGTGTAEDELMITGGGQQAIDLFTRIMVSPGESIVVEEPTFMGALGTFRACGANLCPVPMESDGMDLGVLEQVLKTQKNVKFIYVITTFQNPTGFTTSWEKRRAIYALAQKYDVMILEDNPYFELRYSGENVPPLKSLDQEGRVLFAGSLSKILSPGLRLGFAHANKQLIGQMTKLKQASDVHSNLFFQVVAAEYFNRYDLDEHIAACCALYRQKRDLMLEQLEKHLPKEVTFSRPDGGLFVWVQLPQGQDGSKLAALAAQNKVAVVPGVAFLADGGKGSPGFRLNYSTPTSEQIIQGTSTLGQCVRQLLGQ